MSRLHQLLDDLRVPFPLAERRRYAKRGFIIQEPSQMPCLMPASEWHPDSFIALKGKIAELSVLRAHRPGHGAWTRLFHRLIACERRVVVCCPLDRFEEHIRRMGFSGPHWREGIPTYSFSPQTQTDARTQHQPAAKVQSGKVDARLSSTP